MENKRPLIAHISMFLACAFWGLMAPLGKDAMTHGIDGICMVSLRVFGACILFWIASLFVRHEHVPFKDKIVAMVKGVVKCCSLSCEVER